MITLNTLKPYKRTGKKRVGRGHGSGLGTTAGRGTKGQRARTGGRKRLTRRSLKSLIERLPKIRGERVRDERKVHPITLTILEKRFEAKAVVTPDVLIAAGLLRWGNPFVVVNTGTITKPLTIKAHKVTKGAAEAIKKVGGTYERLPSMRVQLVKKTRDRNATPPPAKS